MSDVKPGERVFAIRNVIGEVVYTFGLGVYAGEHYRPGTREVTAADITEERLQEEIKRTQDVDALAPELMKTNEALMRDAGKSEESIQAWKDWLTAQHARPIRERALELAVKVDNTLLLNPRIDLDNGNTAWGFECWWGPEDQYKQLIEDKTVIEVVPVYNTRGDDE